MVARGRDVVVALEDKEEDPEAKEDTSKAIRTLATATTEMLRLPKAVATVSFKRSMVLLGASTGEPLC